MSRVPRNAIIAAALAMGVLAAFLAYSYMSKPAPSGEGEGKIQIVAAGKSIATGAILTEDMMRMQTVPQSALPADAVSDPQAVLGKVAMRDIKPGEPLAMGALSEKSRLSHMIPMYMRAVTVAVDPIIGVGGYLEPGDHVDVIATYNVNDGSIAKTVLQDVQLIAIGSEVVEEKATESADAEKAAPKTQTNATLAVMPTAAEKLVLAESRGKLRLVLRRSDDQTFVETKGVTTRALFGIVQPDSPKSVTTAAARPPAPVVRPAPPVAVPSLPPLDYGRYEIKPHAPTETQGPPKKIIEIIRGTKTEEVTVDR